MREYSNTWNGDLRLWPMYGHSFPLFSNTWIAALSDALFYGNVLYHTTYWLQQQRNKQPSERETVCHQTSYVDFLNEVTNVLLRRRRRPLSVSNSKSLKSFVAVCIEYMASAIPTSQWACLQFELESGHSQQKPYPCYGLCRIKLPAISNRICSRLGHFVLEY